MIFACTWFVSVFLLNKFHWVQSINQSINLVQMLSHERDVMSVMNVYSGILK